MHIHLFYVQHLVLNNTGVLAIPTGSLRLANIYQAYAYGRLICVIVCFSLLFICFLILYYIKNQQGATLAVLFISNSRITLHVSDAFCVNYQEY